MLSIAFALTTPALAADEAGGGKNRFCGLLRL